MLHKTIRPITDEDRSKASKVQWRLPLFAFDRRRRLRRDIERGEVEVVTFAVERVWTLITCLGPPCCANNWLIHTGDEFVTIESWEWLGFMGDAFPGREVTIERLPSSQVLLSASASGGSVPVVPVENLCGSLTKKDGWRKLGAIRDTVACSASDG